MEVDMLSDWILNAFGAAICFVAMLLLWGKVCDMGISFPISTLIVFGLAFLLCIGWVMQTGDKIAFSKTALLLLILISFFLVAGNVLNVRAMNLAPNKGYADAIVSSRFLLITFVSAVFMGGEFNPKKIFGIAMVCGGMFIISSQ